MAVRADDPYRLELAAGLGPVVADQLPRRVGDTSRPGRWVAAIAASTARFGGWRLVIGG